MPELCFWSIGDGDYAYMLKSLVESYRAVGMTEDFHVFSDRNIPGAHTHQVPSFDKKNYYFKLHFFQSEVSTWDYQYFAYLDADTLFLKKPQSILETMRTSPVHFFLENDCTQPSQKRDWWGCPLEEYVRMMRDCGVTHPHVYHLNSGFFIVKREAIQTLCELAKDFWKYTSEQGYFLPDEPAWAYAMHMLCLEPEKHRLDLYPRLWCTDWEGVFADKLPDGNPWTFKNYLNPTRSHIVNPAIIHAVKSKSALIQRGKTSF